MQPILENFSKQLQDTLDANNQNDQRVVEKGLLLFRQQSVLTITNVLDVVKGKVQDITPVTVALDLNHFHNSFCSCPQEGFCRHQLALFFQYYSGQASVFHWVQEWKKEDRSFSILNQLKRGSDLMQNQQKKENYTVENWLDNINEIFHSSTVKTESYIDEWIPSVYHQTIRKGPKEREWRPMYQLFVAYTFFKQINEQHVETDAYHELYRSTLYYLLDEIEDAVEQLSVTSLPFAFDSFITFIRKDSLYLLTDKTYIPSLTTELYFVLWIHLFKQKDWRKAELKTIQEYVEQKTDENRINIGYTHLAFLNENDSLTFELIDEYGYHIAFFAHYWLKSLKQTQDRLAIYLEKLLPYLSEYLYSLSAEKDRFAFSNIILKNIQEDKLGRKRTHLLEKIYFHFLPYSYGRFNDYLFSKGQYKEWLELQVFCQHDLTQLDNEKLKIINQKQPYLLLPLYHEAIQSFLQQRNRDAYKKTVSYLKKTKTIYRKENNLSHWNQFFDELLESTKRLRAFHEECKRGKLLDA